MTFAELLPELIAHDAMTLKEMAEAGGVTHQRAGEIVAKFRGSMHVAGWERSKRGPMQPRYLWGAGEDAPQPEKYSSSERCRRYRATEKGRKVSQKCGKRWRRSAAGIDYNRWKGKARYSREVFESKGVAAIDPLLAAIMGVR